MSILLVCLYCLSCKNFDKLCDNHLTIPASHTSSFNATFFFLVTFLTPPDSYMCFGSISKYILTPNQNELILSTNQYLNDCYQNKVNVTNYRYDDMDETDHKTQTPSPSVNSHKTDAIVERPKIFCCGSDTLTSVKTMLNRPGQAVQIVTSSEPTGRRERDRDENGDVDGDDEEDEVGECSKISTIRLPETAAVGDSKCNAFGLNKLAYLSDSHLDCIAGSNGDGDGYNETENGFDTLSEAGVMPSTSDRSQNDLIKFVFTSHGIRVISDKEYVV